MDNERLIGKLVHITDKESLYYDHWGHILDWDGDVFHISGGSISDDNNPTLIPIFDRDQFTIPNKRSYSRYIGAGAKIDSRGYKFKTGDDE